MVTVNLTHSTTHNREVKWDHIPFGQYGLEGPWAGKKRYFNRLESFHFSIAWEFSIPFRIKRTHPSQFGALCSGSKERWNVICFHLLGPIVNPSSSTLTHTQTLFGKWWWSLFILTSVKRLLLLLLWKLYKLDLLQMQTATEYWWALNGELQSFLS